VCGVLSCHTCRDRVSLNTFFLYSSVYLFIRKEKEKEKEKKNCTDAAPFHVQFLLLISIDFIRPPHISFSSIDHISVSIEHT